MGLAVEIFKDQHLSILRIGDRIEAYVNEGTINDPDALRSLLSRFLGKLNVHLDMEQYCFGKCISHRDESFFTTYSQSLKDFREKLNSYIHKWASPTAIREEEQPFIEDTLSLLSEFKNLVRIEEMQFKAITAKAA